MDVNILKEVKNIEQKAEEIIEEAKKEGELKIANVKEKIKNLWKEAEGKLNEEKIRHESELKKIIEDKKVELQMEGEQLKKQLFDCSSKNKETAMKFILEKVLKI